MFESVYSSTVTPVQFFLMAAVALACGLAYSWLMSRRIRSTKRFFLVTTLLPLIVASVITFVNGNIGAGVAIGGAFGLIRFRSAQGSADELAAILIAMGGGIAFGMGYLGYGAVIMLGLGALYFLIAALPLFSRSGAGEELILRVTVPEDFEFTAAFDDIFARYCASAERAGVKTTGMGSMFRLTYRVRLHDIREEKPFIDALRTRNGNLEISLLPDAQAGNTQL